MRVKARQAKVFQWYDIILPIDLADHILNPLTPKAAGGAEPGIRLISLGARNPGIIILLCQNNTLAMSLFQK